MTDIMRTHAGRRYTNEGCHGNGPVGWPTIPPSLDVISIDGYHVVRSAE